MLQLFLNVLNLNIDSFLQIEFFLYQNSPFYYFPQPYYHLYLVYVCVTIIYNTYSSCDKIIKHNICLTHSCIQ